VLKRTVNRVCDICGADEGTVSRYRIEYVDDPRHLTVDLCDVHSKPLERIREKVPAKGGRRSGPREREVLPPTQVRKVRSQAKKKAPRS